MKDYIKTHIRTIENSTIMILVLGVIILGVSGYFESHGNVFGIELLVVIGIFFIIQMLKGFRYYIILLEHELDKKQFLKDYIKCNFINAIIPFKLGEIYRIYKFGKQVKSYKIGVISVGIDRLFDTFVLIIFLLPYYLIYKRNIGILTFVLIIAISLTVFMYIFWEPTSIYMNNYFICKSTSSRSLYFLKILDFSNKIYLDVKKIIISRGAIIFFISVLAWMIEFIMLKRIGQLLLIKFDMHAFSEYINDAFSGNINKEINYIVIICATIIFLIMLSTNLLSSFKRRETNE